MEDKEVGELWRNAHGIGQQTRPFGPREQPIIVHLIRKLVEESKLQWPELSDAAATRIVLGRFGIKEEEWHK